MSSPTQPRFREVIDDNGRVYRIGETDRDIMGRSRAWMVWMPWIAMMAISSSEYAFTSAEDTLVRRAPLAARPHLLVAGRMGVLPGRGGVPGRSSCGRAASCRRASAMMFGAAGALLGYLSLAYSPHVFWAYLGFGFFGGAAAGFVYATCVNMVGKWYPERKGGKTGFVNGGFAYGSVPFIFLFTSYMDVGNYQGILFAVGVFLAGVGGDQRLLLQGPAEELVAPARRPARRSVDDPRIRRALLKNPPAVKQYTPMEAIKTGILPLMWFVLLCTAGINIFGIAMQVPFGKEMGFAGGIVALAMSLKAIINGTGRGVIGWISDLYGRRNTLIIVCVVLGLAQYAVFLSGSIGSMPLFLLASMVSGFGGGAIFPLFAAMTADYFGENNNATNYGLVYSSKVISGLVGAGMGSVVVDNWGYGAAFMIAGSVGVACAFISIFLRQPKLRKQAPTEQAPIEGTPMDARELVAD